MAEREACGGFGVSAGRGDGPQAAQPGCAAAVWVFGLASLHAGSEESQNAFLQRKRKKPQKQFKKKKNYQFCPELYECFFPCLEN